MAGEIITLERKLRYLRESIVNLDGTIRLFDPDAEPAPAKLPRKRTKLFGAGGLNRMILDALRRAGQPMTTGEVIDAVTVAAGFGDDARKGMAHRVRNGLAYLAARRGLVVRDGEREGVRWGLRSETT
ncbi:MAG TPA: hypothetical protein VH414_00680 [Lichenihabitans sp.]|nr:hypothetical protein [Lichenihabitans sp.]